MATQPLALPCYPDAQYDEAACAEDLVGWYSSTYESSDPVGLDYPTNITFPPVDITAGDTAGSCTLRPSPVYAVNATTLEDISAALTFAKKHNIRVIIKSTGHDMLGRSEGYGSFVI